MEELRDEDVHLEHVGDVLPLDVPEDVDEPLEVSVRLIDQLIAILINYNYW